MANERFGRLQLKELLFGFSLIISGFGTSSVAAAPPVKDDPFAGVTQSWDKNLPSTSRFTVLSAFGGAAVRDNNTGLVWEQAPSSTARTWAEARVYCATRNVGGAVGWRLPSVIELKSVQDPSSPAPFVPSTIFNGIQLGGYWSSTTAADIGTAWGVVFTNGDVLDGFNKVGSSNVWCVRGPMNADAY